MCVCIYLLDTLSQSKFQGLWVTSSTNMTLLFVTTKVCLVKPMVFPVAMYGCESWTIKKAERRRIDAFELWCWRRLLTVRWTARRSNHSILKEISPDYSLEGLMLKLKLQYFGHLMQRNDSLEKTLMLGKIEGRRRRGRQRMRCWMASLTRQTWVWASSGSWWWTGKPGMLQSMGSQSQTGLRVNWTDLWHHVPWFSVNMVPCPLCQHWEGPSACTTLLPAVKRYLMFTSSLLLFQKTMPHLIQKSHVSSFSKNVVREVNSSTVYCYPNPLP